MTGERGSPPLRPFAWLLACALVLALLVTVVLSGRWRGEVEEAPPPSLGQVPEFSLLNRDGGTVTREDLLGEAWIADFIFTRCALSCPLMTSRMLRVGAEVPGLRRVSFTVDPEYDSPEVLASYAASYGIRDTRWLFLTGETDELLSLIRTGFKLGVVESSGGEAPEAITHSTRFVLVDPEGDIRGYYDAFEEGDLDRLVRDARRFVATRGQSR